MQSRRDVTKRNIEVIHRISGQTRKTSFVSFLCFRISLSSNDRLYRLSYRLVGDFTKRASSIFGVWLST